jgi:hypothetical protein
MLMKSLADLCTDFCRFSAEMEQKNQRVGIHRTYRVTVCFSEMLNQDVSRTYNYCGALKASPVSCEWLLLGLPWSSFLRLSQRDMGAG